MKRLQNFFSTHPIPKLIAALFGLGIVAAVFITSSSYLPYLGPPRTITTSTTTLQPIWQFAAGTSIRYLPAPAGDIVLVRASDSVIALDSRNGTKRWSYTSGSTFQPDEILFVQDDLVLFRPHQSWQIYALDKNNGTLRWQTARNLSDGAITGAALDDSQIYVFSGREGIVWAYNLKDGTLACKSQPLHTGFYNITPRSDGLYLFNNGDMFVLDSMTCALKKTIKNSFHGLAPWVFGSQVYQSDQGTLVVRDINTGAEKWRFNKTPSYLSVIQNQVFVAANDGTLSALDSSTGSLIWDNRLNSIAAAPVIKFGDNGYLLLANGTILEFDLSSGEISGSTITAPTSTSPYYMDKGLAAENNSMYATFGDNSIFAFQK